MSRVLIALLIALSLLACARPDSKQTGHLAGLAPVRAAHASFAERITDGTLAREGDSWNCPLATVLAPASVIEWDLGEPKKLGFALVQGDENDEYVVSISSDGNTWSELWRAPPSGSRGLATRTSGELGAEARFVRLTPGPGDGSFGVSELALFAEPPENPTALFQVKRGLPVNELHRSAILMFGLALVLFVAIASRSRPWLTLAALILPVWAGIDLYSAFAQAWPAGPREVAMVRGVAAFVALAALGRELVLPKLHPASRPAVIGTLSVAAVLALAAFANLGHPQFFDAKNARPSVVHNHDMRVYFPVAKYFHELRFDGLYVASVAAYVDDTGESLDSLANVQLRDLRTHRMRRVSEVTSEIEAVRHRFSPERWQSFVADMRYFRETMSPRGYLDTLTDHGGNATPVWIALAHGLFFATTASNSTLIWGALLDPLLLLIAFIAIGRTFGLRTMLVSMVVFGANDFYMFGSNWAGATLRHDWMAYLALGACALKRERWMLGGALLALSAAIRAFPAFALVGAAIPALIWLGQQIYVNKKLPNLSSQKPIVRVALGALIAAVVCVAVSSLVLSPSAWTEWLHKVSLLDRDPHTNHVSLRGLVAGNDGMHALTLRARMPLFATLAALYAILVALAARRQHLSRAALLGTLLIPVAFNPANYYIHFIFVLPLLALEIPGSERRDFILRATLLAICVLQYWTVPITDWELHFQLATVLLFAGITIVLITVITTDHAAQAIQDVSPATEALTTSPERPATTNATEPTPASAA